ncbi:MAG: penicillin acylase family protein [bacterium]|nr:penicillin acylase family protein [bacterium]
MRVSNRWLNRSLDPYAMRVRRTEGGVADQLSETDTKPTETWGRRQQFVMKHIVLGGRLPHWFSFDRGPYELPGCRATVVQGGIFEAHGRQTTFCPSWRCVTDLGSDRIETVLAGGPSGRRFSRYYATDVKAWLEGRYKTLTLTE